MIDPKIVDLVPRKMLGLRITTSLAENRTRELWSKFKPRVKEIDNRADNDFYSIQEYPEDLKMEMFTPHTKFTKWAAVQVSDIVEMPEGMDYILIPGGLYAVFIHKGPAHTFYKTSQLIFGHWIPSAEYLLDNRPHFEIMSENYLGPDHPESEEKVWIPIRPKL